MSEPSIFNNTSKGRFSIPIIVLTLTFWVIYQQYFKNYIVGINGWGLGFCALFPYAVFEGIEKLGGKSSDRFAALKVICGFVIFIAFLMIVFEWKANNLNFFFWFLIFGTIGFFAFVVINTIGDSPVIIANNIDEIPSEELDDFDDELEVDYSKINSALAADERFPQGATGKFAQFDYESRDGFLNDWRISDWVATDIMIQGKKINSNEYRTFRKDRIVNWISE